MIGETVSHYRILSKLGQGGMGEVYLAEDIRLGHKVAIKRLPEHLVADEAHRQRFEREARAVAHLSHPNILRLLEFDEVDRDLILVTEYVSGGDLREVIRAHPDGIAPGSFFRWATQAADALALAHSQKVLHRDIKPANLFLTADRELRVADFGLTQLAELTRITQPGAVMGTLAYMAPEQLRGDEVDARADVFSLGATYLELLLGQRGEGGAASYAMLEFHPGSLTAHRPELPPELETLILQMLQKDPARRPASAEEVAQRLREIAQTMGLSAGLPTLQDLPSPKHLARRFVLALLLLVPLGWFVQQRWFGRPPAPEDSIPSVAVLPLRDVSGGQPDEYLAAGITEALMVDLSRIASLSVISRRSAEQLAGSEMSMPEIARRLGADVVLDGSILRSGDHIKITATLVDGNTDRNIWVSDFDGELQDAIHLQRQIALAVARGIGAEITETEEASLENARSVDARSMERYLQARMLWRQRNATALTASEALYREILADDPDFAEAWVGLAAVEVVLPSYADVTPRETYPEARRCAERALNLDPGLGEAWNILSEVAYILDLDYAECERLRLESLARNPSSATTHQWHAEFLGAMERHEEAMEQIRSAQRLDPLSPLMKSVEGQILIYAHRFEDAVEVLQRVLVSQPDFVLAQVYLAMALQYAGKSEESAEAYIAWQKTIGAGDEVIQELEDAVARDGALGIQRALLEKSLARLQEGGFVKARSLAAGYAALGDVENSLLWLESSYRDRDIALLRLAVNPTFDSMRDDPRFREIMRRIGLAG